MKRFACCLALLLVFALSLSVPSARAFDDADVPDLVFKGAKVFLEKGPEAGFTTWLEGSALQRQVDVKIITRQMGTVEDIYGKCIGYAVNRLERLSPRTMKVFLEMDYERGPCFLSLMLYRSDEGWILAGKFDINTDPAVLSLEGEKF